MFKAFSRKASVKETTTSADKENTIITGEISELPEQWRSFETDDTMVKIIIIKRDDGGLGLSLKKNGDGLPMVGGFKDMPDGSDNPAHAAGVCVDDVLIGMNDQEITTVKDVPKIMKGAAAGALQIIIQRIRPEPEPEVVPIEATND